MIYFIVPSVVYSCEFFYLKREGDTERTEANPDAVFPILRKIIIGNTIVQFGSKLKIEEWLWGVKSGWAIGKSRVPLNLTERLILLISPYTWSRILDQRKTLMDFLLCI